MASMPTKRHWLGVASVNGKIYAIGGESGPNTLDTNEMFDPATNKWITKASMLTAMSGFAVAVHEDKIYAIGGVTQVYDTKSDKWSWAWPIPTSRSWHSASVVDGKIYVIGGSQMPTYGLVPLSVNEVYDPETGSWTSKTPLPVPVYGHASVVVNNKIYIISGITNNMISNLVQIYDSATDTWSFGKTIPTAVGFAAAGATTGVIAPKRIYVIGGSIAADVAWDYVMLNLNQVYDPEADSWSGGTSMSTSRDGLGVAVVNDLLYAIGGYEIVIGSGGIYALNEQYTPFGYGTVQPLSVLIVSPENKTYTANDVSLTFIVDKPASWIGYSLNGKANVTITGNTTLLGLPDSSYSLTLYVKDAVGNMGKSEIIQFTIVKETELQPQPFPHAIIATAFVSVAAVSAGLLLFYFWKRSR